MVDREPIVMTGNRGTLAEELLASTTFKDSLRMLLKHIDPESGPELVRTLLGKDPEVPMALLSVLPILANTFIRSALEFVSLLRSIYPSQLLAGMVESLLQDVDREALVSLIREARALGSELAPVLDAFARAVEDPSSTGKEAA